MHLMYGVNTYIKVEFNIWYFQWNVSRDYLSDLDAYLQDSQGATYEASGKQVKQKEERRKNIEI